MRERSRNSVVMLLVAFVIVGGCATSPSTPPGRILPARSAILDSPFGPLPGETPPEQVQAPPLRVLDVNFQIMRVDIPQDDVRHSAKIWNHVRATELDPDRVETLARNGMAVGVGTEEDWPALRAILTAARARVRVDQMLARSGLPVSVELGRIEEAESIFSWRPGQRPAGRTFDRGSKLLHIDYAVDRALPGLVNVQLGFEIRDDRGEVTWKRVGGALQQVPVLDQFVYDQLDVLLPVGPGGFIVVGPAPLSESEYMVGNRFFSSTIDGRRFDTLVVIAPAVQETVQTFTSASEGRR